MHLHRTARDSRTSRNQGRPRVVSDREGRPNLQWGSRSFYVPSVSEAVQETLSAPQIHQARLVVLIGAGLGHELAKLLSQTHHRKLIVIEPSLECWQLAERQLGAECLKDRRLTVFTGSDLSQLKADFFQRLNRQDDIRSYLQSLAVVVPAGTHRFYGLRVQEITQAIQDTVQDVMKLMGDSPFDALMGLDRIFRNLPRFISLPEIADMEGAWAGYPAVVASAGPTLNRALPELRKLQGKVPIICPDTSLKILVAAGIQPSLVVSRERVNRVLLALEGPEGKDVPLVVSPVVHPACLTQYQGPIAGMLRACDFPQLLGMRSDATLIGTAGNIAFQLALHLKADPIVLVGQNLCFGETGQTHAGGAATGENQKKYEQAGLLEVPGTHRAKVKTSSIWLPFLNQFARDIQASSATVLNATEDGAMIPGAQVIELSTWAQQLFELPAPPTSFTQLPEPPAPAVALERYQTIERALTTSLKELPEILEACHQGAQLAERLRQCTVSLEHVVLDELIKLEAVSVLEELRGHIAKTTCFLKLIWPMLAPFLSHEEMLRYQAEFESKDGTELARSVAHHYSDWFRLIEEAGQKLQELILVGLDTLSGCERIDDAPEY